MNFRELPIEILHKVLEECFVQGSSLNLDASIASDSTQRGFDWDGSIEGDDFWQKVLMDGDWVAQCSEEGERVFYERFPKRISQVRYDSYDNYYESTIGDYRLNVTIYKKG